LSESVCSPEDIRAFPEEKVETCGHDGADAAAQLREFPIDLDRDPACVDYLRSLPLDQPVRVAEIDGEAYCIIRLGRPLDKITGRQREIIQMVASGMSNKAIASRLGVQPATVASHMSRIFRKFNINSRAALAKYGLKSYL